jgi:hypothetical protein
MQLSPTGGNCGRVEDQSMSLARLLRVIGRQLHDLAQYLGAEEAPTGKEDREDRRGPGRHEHYSRLIRLHRTAERLRLRIEKQERREARLAQRVARYLRTGKKARAWDLAMELDETRQDLQRDRARLEERRQRYQECLAKARQSKCSAHPSHQ